MNTHQIIKHRRSSKAIVLLVVLGMLSLFSVLIVTYVVFSSQARQTAFGNSLRRDRDVDNEPIFDSIISQVLAGGNPRSATFRQDLLGDLYGVDHIKSRVAHVRASSGFTGGLEYRAVLLRPSNTSLPDTTLFKLPLHLIDWNRDGAFANDAVVALTPAEFAQPNFRMLLTNKNLPDYRLNDAFTGRLVTFVEGPLKDNSFRIVRYFGTTPATTSNADMALAGCIVIDLAEAKSKTVVFEGANWDLFKLAKQNPNALAYGAGDDQLPGYAANTSDVLGQPQSDDVGYGLLINGVAFNGLGENASTSNQLTRTNPYNSSQPYTVDPQFGPELLPNRKITGRVLEPSQPDELYDAADFDNWMLAWQPADHRAILPSLASALANQTGMAVEDAAKATPNIIPSFHRPEVINYLMHKPVTINGTSRTFTQMDGSDPDDIARLQLLIRRLRAATFRPLNFDHLFVRATENLGLGFTDPVRQLYSDLDGDGNGFDGNPGFSGGNPVPILNTPIEVNSTVTFATLKGQVLQLATWMINGPWDVDNDGDDLPDSLWVDFDLPTQVVGNGTVVRPLVAILIEDLDGRINLNAAGNYAHITSPRFQSSNPTQYSDGATYFAVDNSLQTFGRGGGLGPAEINFSHLFDEYRPTDPGNLAPPLFITQTSNPFSSVLSTRYGNLMQSRYGGRPWDYNSTLSSAYFPVDHPGDNTGTTAYPNFSDPFSRVILSARRDRHDFGTPMGRALDMYGRSTTRKQRGGSAAFDLIAADVPTPTPSTTASMTEIVNQPYEFEVDEPAGNDQPFSAGEFHGLADQGSGQILADRLVSLLGSAAETNEALSRLMTFDSRSLDSVELPGGFSVVQFMLDRFPTTLRNNPTQLDVQIQRMLAVELRKGGKLNLNRPLANGVNDLTTGGVATTLTDETRETQQSNPQAGPDFVAAEPAFPQLDNDNTVNTSSAFENQSHVLASYLPLDTTTVGEELDRLTGAELLARNLYCLMFRLILDPQVNTTSNNELVPNFPYPANLKNSAAERNAYVARRLAQWAVNVVDMRDTDAIMTRLRFDPNPFDNDGFDLTKANLYTVWGMERPEIGISETLAAHDRRVKRQLMTDPDPVDPAEPNSDTPTTPGGAHDEEMDQFRIPEASAFVELKSLRDPYFVPAGARSLESFPAELYDLPVGGPPVLDLGRVVGTGVERSPVWRMAVGYTTSGGTGDHRRSTLWTQDAQRFSNLPAPLPSPFAAYGGAAGDLPLWNEIVEPAGDIIHPIGDNSRVYMYDDNLDQGDAPTVPAVTLSRFVWFAALAPDAGINMIGNPNSGMRIDNVFFPSGISGSSVPAKLIPGGYAVVAPRQETIFGSTEESAVTSAYAYYPSKQKFEILMGGTPAGYSLRYTDLDGNRTTPNYPIDNGTNYRVNNILPIVAASLPPHQAEATASVIGNSWSTYFTSAPANERVGVGFNISAPLAGPNYYLAPTYNINEDTSRPNGAYPKIDGYRDYVNDAGNHPDLPFDEITGAPLQANNWVGVGNYQDVASVFLQRLADPTMPWDATHNPYITVDSMAMDLTVFNGDGDMREQIDSDGDGMSMEPVDPSTPVYPTQLAFDTRRKIPDGVRDRPQSALVIRTPTTNYTDLTDITKYDRYVFAQRSLLMTRQSVLRTDIERGTAGVGTKPHFRHQLMSAWNGGTAATSPNPTATLHSGFRYKDPSGGAVDQNAQRFDQNGDHYPSTLGYVNREFGEPAPARTSFAGSGDGLVAGNYVGFPIAVNLQLPTWLDRPFQSIHDLISVPATSNSRFSREYDPGTRFEPIETAPGSGIFTGSRETPIRFKHLLGFEAALGDHQAGDTANVIGAPATIVDPNMTAGITQLTGKRAGFEKIFDVVDIGPLSFGQKRWYDPVQVRRLSSAVNLQDQMFNRSMQLFQAPFNYSERHRTTGKVNLNTTPDYIRQGAAFQSTFSGSDADLQRPFTAGTNPQDVTSTSGLSGINSEPTNYRAGRSNDPFNTANLYGNGSVYRSLVSGFSTAYDLDDSAGEPRTLGAYNGYKQTVDSRFGYGFKAFIHSRRGYGSTLFNPAESLSQLHFLNPDLDYRYPTRFAGLFAPTAGAGLPSVQRHMHTATALTNEVTLRRTHDMSLHRPDRDFDIRVMDNTARTAATTTTATEFTLPVESRPPTTPVALPVLTYVNNAANTSDTTPTTLVENLRMPLVGTGVFERPQAELHRNHRLLDRDPFYRFQNPAYLSGMTTHHSNLFMLRYTVGFFVVDPATGAFGAEYLDPREGYSRPRGFHIIDRSISVGYEAFTGTTPGRDLNSTDAVIYSYTK